jgi:hypothetical protein
MVWWEMENIPLPPYDLLDCSHALVKQFWFSTTKRIWACLVCKRLSKCLHMDAWKDYLKMFILLSPNQTYIYNIAIALHHHIVL